MGGQRLVSLPPPILHRASLSSRMTSPTTSVAILSAVFKLFSSFRAAFRLGAGVIVCLCACQGHHALVLRLHNGVLEPRNRCDQFPARAPRTLSTLLRPIPSITPTIAACNYGGRAHLVFQLSVFDSAALFYIPSVYPSTSQYFHPKFYTTTFTQCARAGAH